MEVKKQFIVNVLFYGLVIGIVVLFAQYILPILTPFLIAFCVAGLMEFITKHLPFLKQQKLRRFVSLVLCTTLYAVFFLGVLLAGARLINVAVDFFKAVPSIFTNQIMPFMQRMGDQLETAVTPYDTMLAKMIDEVSSSVIKTVSSFVTELSGKAVVWATSSVASIPGLIVQTVIMVISTFFMVLDFDKICKFLLKLIPAGKRELFTTSLHYTKTMITVYIKSYSILFLLTFAELTIGFFLLGVGKPLLMAGVIAVLDVLPILGTGGFLLPWAVLEVIFGNYLKALGVLALYLVIAGIRNTVEPKIVGKQIGLHPLATLVAMLLGLKLFGLVGMLGVPVLLAVTTAMYRNQPKGETKAETTASVS